MKNNRSKRRAFEWKHLKSNRHFSLPYMQRHSFIDARKNRLTFNISEYKRVLNYLFIMADIKDNFPHGKRGERTSVMTKGVYLNYRDMKFSICGLGDGVKRGNKSI